MEQPENSSPEGEGKAVETSTTATTPQIVAPPTKHAVPTRALPPTPTQHASPTPTSTTAPTSATDNAATQPPAVLSPRSTQPPPPPSRDTKPSPTFSEASFSSLSASSSSLPAYATTSHSEPVVSATTTTITATLPRPNVQQIQEQVQAVAGGSGQGAGSKVASLITKTNMSPEEELQRLKEVHETMVKKLQQWQSDLLKRPAVTPVPMSEARAKVEEILKEAYPKPGHPSSIVMGASTPTVTVGAAGSGTVAALVAGTGAGNRGSTRGPSATISSLNSSSNSNPNPPKVSPLVRSLSQSYGKNNTSSNQLQPPPQPDMSVSSDATPTKLPPAPSSPSPSPSHSSSAIEALKGTTTSQPTTPQPDRKKTPEQQVEALTAEFLQTERTYVNGLRVLVEVYLKGVRADELMSVKDIQTVFSNVDVIFELNQKLLSDLEKTHEEGGGSILKNLCDNLGTFIPFLKMYTQYINNYDNAHKRVKKLSNSAAFKAFLQQCKSRPECNSLGLHDHLIMPVQRLPRYELLLRDILRYTPDDSAEHSKIKNLLGTIQNVNKYVNESKRSQETRQKLYKLKDACKPKGVDIFDRPHRELIKELTLSSHEVQPGEEGRFINHTDSIKFKEHHFFLFDDMMVEVQKLKSDKFKFIRHYNLLHYEVKLSLLEDWLKSKEDSKLNKPAAGAEQHHYHHRPSSAGLQHQLQTKGGGGMSRTSSEIKLGAPVVDDGEDGTESEGSGIHTQRHQQQPLEGSGSDSPLVGKQEQWRRSISGLHNGGGTAAAAASEERAATTEAEEAPDPTSPASTTSTDQQQPHVGALPPGELEMQMQMLMAATQMQMAGSSTSFVLVNRLLDKRVVIRTSSIEAKKEIIRLIEDARERAKALQSEPAKAAEGLPSGSAISNIAGTGLGTLLDGGGEGESSEEEGEGEEHAATNSGSVVVEEQEQQHQKKKGASMPKRIKSMKLKKEKKKDRRGSLAPSSGSESNSGIGAGGSTPEQPNPLASSASGLPSSGNSTGGTIRGRIVSAFNKKGSADKGVAGGGTDEDEKKGSKKKKLFGFS